MPLVIHWRDPAGGSDPFLAGVRWGLSTTLTFLFGETLGSLLNTAVLTNVQRWNGSQWANVA